MFLQSKYLDSDSALRELVAIVPVLLIAGIGIQQTFSIVLLVLMFGYLSRFVSPGGKRLFESDFIGFAVAISLLGFFKAIIPAIRLDWVVLSLGIATAILLVLQITLPETNLSYLARHQKAPGKSSVWANAFAISGVLYVNGWVSLGLYSAALGIILVLRCKQVQRFGPMVSLTLFGLGLGASYRQNQFHLGQYWLSYDQLFRSALADGLSTWGTHDNMAATGTTIRYHWLGEASAGVLGRLTSITPTDSVTKVFPILGISLCLVALQQIGTKLKFHRFVVTTCSATTILLIHQFEVYSIGSLWGAGLFLVGLNTSLSIYQQANENQWGLRTPLGSIFLLTPLITMTQATLGLYFTCLNLLLVVVVFFHLRRISKALLYGSVIQVAILLALQKTLLNSSAESSVYDPTLSIFNFLQFRGNDLYGGNDRFFVWAVSTVFLFTLSQMIVGVLLWTRSRHKSDDKIALYFFLAILVTSLVLMNLFSIGGGDAQQMRFATPVIIVGTYWGLLAIFNFFYQQFVLTSLRASTIGLVLTVLLITAGIVGLRYELEALGWSRERSYGIATLVIFTQVVFVFFLILRKMFTKTPRLRLTFVILLLAISLIGHSEKITKYLEIHQIPTDNGRAQPFTGDLNQQDCLRYLRVNTPKNSIVASNLFRIPLATRDEKYFLVSAYSHRRNLVDGPNYIANPRPVWLQQRVQVSDEFGENPSRTSYDSLMAAGVDFFLMQSPSVPISSWSPYARVVHRNNGCIVLKLVDS